MQCPICGRPVQPSDPCKPFCSDRCRLIDLGKWADQEYVISTPAQPPASEDEDDQ